MTAYEAHPAAEIFPLLKGEELRVLADQIRESGLIHAIVLHEGKVLDGRNRLRACELAGVAPRFVAWSGKGDPTDWVVNTNLHRRHLTTSQRALIAVELKKRYEAKARARMHAGRAVAVAGTTSETDAVGGEAAASEAGGATPAPKAPEPAGATRNKDAGKAAEKAAKATRISAKTVERAEKLVTAAAPELLDAVRAGAATVAAATAVAKLPADEQRAVVREGKVPEKARALREQAKPAKTAPAPGAGPGVSDDALPLNLREFKAAYKRGRPVSKRTPGDEVARLQQIAVTVALVDRAWTWIDTEWHADHRADMRFAIDAGAQMTPLLKEFRKRLDEIIATARAAVDDVGRP